MTIDGKPLGAIQRAKAGENNAKARARQPVDVIHRDTIYREPAVLAVTGWSHGTLWDRIKNGLFVKPVS